MSANSREFDFQVIYNRALSSKSHTNDTRLSSNFTEFLVDKFEADGKTKGYLQDRDAIPGRNVFNVLNEMVKNTKKTIVVVTPEFIRNCWQTYAQQSAFKRLIDNQQAEKLIPIALCISDIERLEELNIAEWIHFEEDYETDSEPNKRNWRKIQMALAGDTQWNTPPLVTQDHGDNRLRTESDTLVTQPTDFFSDALIQEIAEQFPTDWNILCIKFGLKSHVVDRIRVDHPNDSRRQAFEGLKSCLSNQGIDEQKKFDGLREVLHSMGRTDIIESLKNKHREYEEKQSNVSVQSSESDHRQGGFVQVVEPEQPEEAGQDIPDSSNETSFISRELRPPQTAVINTESAHQSDLLYSSTEPLSMDRGPSLSLPSAPVIKVPGGQAKKPSASVPSNDGRSLTEGASGDSPNETGSSNGNDRRKLDPTSHQGCGDNVPHNRTAPSNEIRVTEENTELKVLYGNQYSLSNDDDVTIDTESIFSFQPVGDQLTNVSAVNSSRLDEAQMLNLKSFDDDPSIDSGVGSIANTPLNGPSLGSQIGHAHNGANNDSKQLVVSSPVEEQMSATINQTMTSKHSVPTGLTEDHSPSNEDIQAAGSGNATSKADVELGSSSIVSNNGDRATNMSNFFSFLCRLIAKPEYAYN